MVVTTTAVLTVLESCNCIRYLPFLLSCFVCFDFVPYSSYHPFFAFTEMDGRNTNCVDMLPPQIFVERTLAIVKPDAIDKTEEIRDIIIKAGFTILQERRVLLTPEEVSNFYAMHFGKLFFPSLVLYMSSGPAIVFVLARQNAVTYWRDMIGPCNSVRARETHPDSLRAIYGTDEQRNAVHGSLTYQDAEREIRFFFHDSILEPIKTGINVQDYLAKAVNSTLLKGLTALCKVKPHDPVIWLADWLLDNNPYKPKVEKNIVTEPEKKENT